MTNYISVSKSVGIPKKTNALPCPKCKGDMLDIYCNCCSYVSEYPGPHTYEITEHKPKDIIIYTDTAYPLCPKCNSHEFVEDYGGNSMGSHRCNKCNMDFY